MSALHPSHPVVDEGVAVSTYVTWLQGQGLEPMVGQYVADMRELPVKPWDRCGGRICYMNHGSSERTNDSFVIEIPPGEALKPERHLFEETIFVLDGRGSTSVYNHRGDEQTFEWQAGSLFSIPLNTWHQHFNLSGNETARFFGVSSAPEVINVFADPDFVFGCEYDFLDRFHGQSRFDGDGDLQGRILDTNFIADVRVLTLLDHAERGAGGTTMKFKLAGNTTWAHSSEFPVGTYKKAHRHGPGAHITVLSGQGYTLMWFEGEEPKRYDWHDGCMVTPPDRGFHQHFNIGPEPARYLALSHRKKRHSTGLRMSAISTKEGGDQINYADEDPMIREMYQEELTRNGVEFRMEQFYEEEKTQLG